VKYVHTEKIQIHMFLFCYVLESNSNVLWKVLWTMQITGISVSL